MDVRISSKTVPNELGWWFIFLNYSNLHLWPLKYIVWWWDFSVVWKWTKSGYYQSFTIYISIIKKIGIFHFFVGFIIVLPSPWISRTLSNYILFRLKSKVFWKFELYYVKPRSSESLKSTLCTYKNIILLFFVPNELKEILTKFQYFALVCSIFSHD